MSGTRVAALSRRSLPVLALLALDAGVSCIRHVRCSHALAVIKSMLFGACERLATVASPAAHDIPVSRGTCASVHITVWGARRALREGPRRGSRRAASATTTHGAPHPTPRSHPDRVGPLLRSAWSTCFLLALASCSSLPRGGYYQDDGPGSAAFDAASIPDAVPRVEPRSPTGNAPYRVNGVSYAPLADARGYRERGVASWYGKKFHGRRTSSGEPYDMYAMTAAHRTLPLPSYVRVRNLGNGRAVVVRVNDRGPFLHDRVIDLSYAAAAKLGIAGVGTGIVEVEAIDPGSRPTVIQTQSGVELTPLPVMPKPTIEIIPTAAADDTPMAGRDTAPPRLYLQLGAFTSWDNAAGLRTRLERAAIQPVFIQSVIAGSGRENTDTRVYRVRAGPLDSVEEADRLSARAREFGVADAHIVVE